MVRSLRIMLRGCWRLNRCIRVNVLPRKGTRLPIVVAVVVERVLHHKQRAPQDWGDVLYNAACLCQPTEEQDTSIRKPGGRAVFGGSN